MRMAAGVRPLASPQGIFGAAADVRAPGRGRLLLLAAGLACEMVCARARGDEVRVEWDRELAVASEREGYEHRLEEIVRAGYEQASAELGLTLDRSLEIKVDTHAHFEEQFGTAAAWIEAAHYSHEVIHINGGTRLDDRFAGYVVHEMAHALFDFKGTAGRLPTWLNEGLAERLRWRRMGLEELSPNQAAELKQARGKKSLTPLPVSGYLSPFGYLQCYAAVLFLEKKTSRASVLRVVRRTLDGEPFEPVLEHETGSSAADLEREFSDWVEHLP